MDRSLKLKTLRVYVTWSNNFSRRLAAMCFCMRYNAHHIAKRRHSLQSMCHIVDMHVVCVVLADDERQRIFFFLPIARTVDTKFPSENRYKTDRTQLRYYQRAASWSWVYLYVSERPPHQNRMYQYPQFCLVS